MRKACFLTSILYFFCVLGSVSIADRLKDLASIAGVRSNQLVGYGVVVGLAGTGDLVYVLNERLINKCSSEAPRRTLKLDDCRREC